jgi:lipooligosaccharide transport system permease protein
MIAPNPKYILAVARRQYLASLKFFGPTLASNVANPLLFLFAFGFGLGQIIEIMDGMSYLTFVIAGVIAYSAAFSASFETTIGSFTRYFNAGVWDAILSTPVTLTELLMGEVIWAMAKAIFSATSVLVVGLIWGGVPSLLGALLALPFVLIAAFCFASVGLLATSYAKGYDFFSYFFTFWITPMFVFCGVFFDINRFPEAVQIIAWFFPMTHLIASIRPLIAGLPVDGLMLTLHTAYVIILGAVAFILANRKMRQRLFD